ALLASKLGRHVILVVEKPSELPLIRQMSLRMGVRPRIGVRSRLSARGSGHWEASGGDRSKFGLTGRDLLDAVSYMKENDLLDTYREVSRKNLLESYHDAISYRDECLSLFNLGHLSLEDRGLAEDLFWATCQKILRITRTLPQVPEDLEGLERTLADTYFCN